ncbi:MAG: hypothetical protein H7X99_04585 [Saprospiraceae bacterium]|nr:hypothetical protein [Saprospiraceae bacterium]
MESCLFKANKAFIIFIVGSLCIYSILVLTNEFSRSSGEIFLIPEKYIGFIYIIYDEKEGSSQKVNGVNTYNIPTSGVFITSTGISKRLNMFESSLLFYYINSKGKRLQIPNCCPNRKQNSTFEENTIAFPFKDVPSSDSDKLFSSKPYFTYQIDSMKNLGKETIPLTKIKYENSKIK